MLVSQQWMAAIGVKQPLKCRSNFQSLRFNENIYLIMSRTVIKYSSNQGMHTESPKKI